MISIVSTALSALSLVSTALGHPANLELRDDAALPNSLPASASYTYLVPALYLNLTVKAVMDLGPLATGGEQLLGHILGGHLYSEPGFEPQFSGTVKYAEDYLTSDANGAYARPSCSVTVVPDNGVDLPFLMEIHGVQKAVPSLDIIFAGNTTGLQAPTFFGGSANYSNLQDSVFVGSETASSSPVTGAFAVAMKFSKARIMTSSLSGVLEANAQ
ncbi:hypothetical protein LTR33_009515 [Friedmanniomyces endolithicus]|nr:hypothetical protein LTR33_009515 [Friedmanniomyces endolithicus]